jgi:TetR/AcrR family fatty acid metabolism transcriptional regulator
MEEKPGDKRDKIIEAAIEVLSKGNYETMKTASVAAKAGIAEGTIYRYFENKRDLFIEVIREIGKRLEVYFLQESSRKTH